MKRFFSLQSFAAILAGSVAVASFNPANSMPVSQQVQRVTSDTTGFTSIREGYNHDVYPDRQYYGQRRYNRRTSQNLIRSAFTLPVVVFWRHPAILARRAADFLGLSAHFRPFLPIWTHFSRHTVQAALASTSERFRFIAMATNCRWQGLRVRPR